MSHDHHGHNHAAPENFNLAFGLAVGLNLAFTIIEAFYALYANSMSLLADAAHNFGDVFGLLLSWGAAWLLTRPATQRYSYGYKRTTILAALVNALILVATSALIAYESIIKLMHPEPVTEIIVICVALIGIIINGGTALLFVKGSKGDLNIKGAFLHLAADALISIGVVIAGVIILYSGWTIIDPIVGLLIVVAILFGTWGLLRDSVNLIMDAVPHSLNREDVYHYFLQIDGVTKVHDLHIWGLSTKEIALTAHIIVPERTISDQELHAITDELKQQFNIHHSTIQVEKGEGDCHVQHTC